MSHSPPVAHKTHLFSKESAACVSYMGKNIVDFSFSKNGSVIIVNCGLIFVKSRLYKTHPDPLNSKMEKLNKKMYQSREISDIFEMKNNVCSIYMILKKCHIAVM